MFQVRSCTFKCIFKPFSLRTPKLNEVFLVIFFKEVWKKLTVFMAVWMSYSKIVAFLENPSKDRYKKSSTKFGYQFAVSGAAFSNVQLLVTSFKER